jgi:hypothetical protein
MNNRLLLVLIGISFVVMSCSKKVVTPAIELSPPKPTLNVEEIDFEYMHGKARMVLRDANKEREVKANIRIRKDSVIWMTFSVIGVQGGKALSIKIRSQSSITLTMSISSLTMRNFQSGITLRSTIMLFSPRCLATFLYPGLKVTR